MSREASATKSARVSPDNNTSRVRKEFGGDEGDRTPDLCNAIAALSQLSYIPLEGHAVGAARFDSSENRFERQGVHACRIRPSNSLELRLSFFQERRNTFLLVFG